MSTNFYVNFLYFIIYSIIGWICEVIFCSVPAKKFVNRGFLNGPLCPIYGFGALIIISLLTPFKDNILILFIFGVILTSILEYLTSYFMEKIFHSRWWDYSHKKFNIHGRVCLLNSILFGIMCIVLMFVVHVKVEKIIGNISYFWIQLLAIVSLMILTVDTTITVQSAFNLNEKMQKLRDLTLEIKENIESSEHASEAYVHIERLIKDFNQTARSNKFFERRLIHAFPDMKSTKFQEQLQSIRSELEKIKHKK